MNDTLLDSPYDLNLHPVFARFTELGSLVVCPLILVLATIRHIEFLIQDQSSLIQNSEGA